MKLRILLQGGAATLAFALLALGTATAQSPGKPTQIPVDVLQYGTQSLEANRIAFERFALHKKRVARNGQQSMLLQERGPSNVGGRTRGIMFDPTDSSHKKVWAGGTTGGLWYNNDITDEESSWKNVSDAWANLSVTSIAADPSDNQKWYVSTGESHAATHFKGAGLWKTTNAGANWTQIPETAIGGAFKHIVKVQVSRNGTLFILTRSFSDESGVWRSTDEGKTWTNVLPGAMGGDFEITGNGDLLATTFVAKEWTGAVYKSSFVDDGAPGTWDNITPAATPQCGQLELAVSPSDANVIYALGSNVIDHTDWGIVTDNGGQSWNFFTPPNELNWSTCEQHAVTGFTDGSGAYKLAATVHPTNPEVLYVGATDIFRTTNKGSSWELIGCHCKCAPLIHADHHTFLFRPGSETEMVLSNDGGVYYSVNAGDVALGEPAYQKRNKNYNVTQFYAAAMENDPGSNYMVAGSQDNGTQAFKAQGYGPTTHIAGGDGLLCFINQNTSKYQVVSSQNNIVFYSTDSGESFTENRENQTVQFENPMEYDKNGSILYMAADNSKLMVTALGKAEKKYAVRDIGLESGSVTALHMSPHVNGRVYVGTSNWSNYILWVSGAVNNNLSIGNQTGNLKLSQVKSIDFGADIDAMLAVGTAHAGQDNQCAIWATGNAGGHWDEKQGDLPVGMQVNYGIFNPTNEDQVMLATEAGLWITGNFSDKFPNWDCFSPNFYVKRLKHRESDGRVAIATYGRGLWTTDIFGASQCKDVHEPNDDWPTNAKTITPGEKVNGTIHKVWDGDFFKFTIEGKPGELGKDVNIYFENKYNAATLVALLKVDPDEKVPEVLASEIANKTVKYSGATPGNYLVWVAGGYSAPETFINCYNLQLEVTAKGKGVLPPDAGAPAGSAAAVNPEWIKEDEWLSKTAKVVLANNATEVHIKAFSLGKPFAVRLVNAAGKPVLEKRVQPNVLGPASFSVPLGKLDAGSYRCKITDGIQTIDRELVKE